MHPLPFARARREGESRPVVLRATRGCLTETATRPMSAWCMPRAATTWSTTGGTRTTTARVDWPTLGQTSPKALAPRRTGHHPQLHADAAAQPIPADLRRHAAAPPAGLADPGDDGQRAAPLGAVCDDRATAARAVFGTEAGAQRRGRLFPSSADGVLPGLRRWRLGL